MQIMQFLNYRKLTFNRQIWLTMKIVLFLMVLGLLQVSAKSNSQSISISKKEINLRQVFKEIKNQTSYVFFYDASVLNKTKRVSINVKDASIEKVLQIALKDQQLSWSIENKTITVIKNKQVLTPSSLPEIKEEMPDLSIEVSGKVLDENGKPLDGVSVIEKGTSNGVTTKNDGKYSINVPEEAVLVFSFIGKNKLEINVRGRKTIDVKMINEQKEMDAIVVTGYFERSKQTYTGAATTFKGTELRNITNQNILSALTVMDPSFKLIENNIIGSDPNQLPDFQIRGANGINSNLDEKYKGNPNVPTFMLDGFEVSLEKIYDLDPQRILSVSILKDAAALAIYGSRGSNGVVVITTTPPAMGKLRLTYNASMDFEAANLSDYNLLNATDKLEYEKLAGLYTPNNYISTGEAYSFYYNERLKLVQAGNNTDWLSKPVKNLGVALKHAIVLEGGDNSFRYAVDLSYNPSTGVMKGSGRDRKGISVKLNYNYKSLRFSNQMSFDNVKVTNSPYGSFSTYAYLNPYYTPVDANGNLKKVLYNIESVQFPTVTVVNPLYNATINTRDESKYDNFINNFGMEWNVTSDLKLNTKFSISKKTQITDIFKPSDHSDFVGVNKKGSYFKATEETFQYEGNAGLSYTKRIDRQLFVLNANYNVREVKDDLYAVTSSGFPNDQMDHVGMGLEYLAGSKPMGYESTSRLMGVLGSLNYSYDNRFLADFSIRYDGSSQFGSNKRWGAFWSAGLGWNLHQEKILQDIGVIDVLRLRGSIGYTGSQSFYPYQAVMMYKYLTDLTYDDYFGAVVNAYGNSDLKWQRTQKRNIGLDFELFDQVISGYVNVYSDYSKDVLVDVTMAPSLGFDTYKANLGEVQNRGFEVSLKATILSNPANGFYWNMVGSALSNRNKLNKISNALSAFNENADNKLSNKPSVRFIEGQSMNTIWAVKSLGIDPATGQEVYEDKNGSITNVWSSEDYIPFGNSDPTLEGTLGTNLGYKGFQLNAYMMYSAGGDIYNSTLVNRVENVNPNFNVDSRVFNDRWRNPGDIAVFKGISNRTLTRPTSRFVERNNWLELKSVNLSYTFDQSKYFSKLGIERVRVSGYLNDVFRSSTVRTERGINYPYAKHYALALQVIF